MTTGRVAWKKWDSARAITLGTPVRGHVLLLPVNTKTRRVSIIGVHGTFFDLQSRATGKLSVSLIPIVTSPSHSRSRLQLFIRFYVYCLLGVFNLKIGSTTLVRISWTRPTSITSIRFFVT